MIDTALLKSWLLIESLDKTSGPRTGNLAVLDFVVVWPILPFSVKFWAIFVSRTLFYFMQPFFNLWLSESKFSKNFSFSKKL